MGSKNFAHFEEKSFGRKMAVGSIPTYLTMYLAIKIIQTTDACAFASTRLQWVPLNFSPFRKSYTDESVCDCNLDLEA